jgi:hypothetical protein
MKKAISPNESKNFAAKLNKVAISHPYTITMNEPVD